MTGHTVSREVHTEYTINCPHLIDGELPPRTDVEVVGSGNVGRYLGSRYHIGPGNDFDPPLRHDYLVTLCRDCDLGDAIDSAYEYEQAKRSARKAKR